MGDFDRTVKLLTHGGSDLKRHRAVFVSVDLMYGNLSVYGADEYAETAPALVGAGWHMRWPIPPLDNNQANALLKEIAPHVQALYKMVSIRDEPLGVILYGGAGTSIDAIQRQCAAAWQGFGQAS
ncbi:hypothetical protein [Streptomyces violascens]|uniref:hypothetical protein n=1 Tax=Streptomyces violascens TaxID=67381 RepID=UPI0036CF1E68